MSCDTRMAQRTWKSRRSRRRMLLSSALMARYRQAFLFAILLGAASFVQPQPHAQTPPDATGEWEASYQTPLGPQELKIYLTQEGPRISGHTTSEYGESQVRGTINGQDIQFTFQSTDGGQIGRAHV